MTMGESSPFVSSCSRRQMARRRAGRSRLYMITSPGRRHRWHARFYAAVGPVLMAASVACVALGAFFAGRGI
jgi:hypothetical protein